MAGNKKPAEAGFSRPSDILSFAILARSVFLDPGHPCFR